MISLPIVERELRVASRKPSYFRARIWVCLGVGALAAILFGLGTLMTRGGGGPGIALGSMLFEVFKWLSFLAASFSGVIFTADCLSEEKRDGTLGLLFLTDLRGHDVVLGKVSIHALQSVYAFLAAFPVIGACFLVGGVTGTEFFRIIVLLLVTLFLSLSVGVLVSACCREASRAMTLTLTIQIFLLLGLPALDLLIAARTKVLSFEWFQHFSPAFPIWQANAIKPFQFYNPILCLTGLATACLIASSLIVPRTWQATPSGPRNPRNPAASTPEGNRPSLRTWHRAILERDAVAWLAQRLYRPGWIVWITTGITVAGLGIAYALRKPTQTPGFGALETISHFAILILTVFFRLWLALQACRFWTDARASGAMELLLVTPLQPRQIIHGQWRALVRAFVPILLLHSLLTAGVGYAQMLESLSQHRASIMGSAATSGARLSEAEFNQWEAELRHQRLVEIGTSVIIQLSSFWAVAWMGMWMGMTTRRIQVAVGKTLLFADFLPMLGVTLLGLVLMATSAVQWGGGWLNNTLVIPAIALTVDIILAWIARRRAHSRFPAFVSGSSGESLVAS